MPSTEERIDATRRQISGLICQSYGRIKQAAKLLERKAELAPLSAEAQARGILLQSQREIEQWLAEAGELVGVEFR